MSMEASEVAVRVRLLGGTAFEKEAQGVADSVKGIGAAGKEANVEAIGTKSGKSATQVKTLGDHVGNLGKKLSALGMGLAPTAAGIAYIGYSAIKAQTQFQKSMMLLVTQAQLPRRNLQGLTKDVNALATAVGQTPTNLANGLFYIVSSGVHNSAKAMSLLKTSGIMAAVGGDTVADTANALMGIYNTNIKGAKNPQQIAAYIEAAIGAGKMHMSDITQSMSTGILPMIKATGMSLPQILAAAAALTRENVPASQVMSRMRLTLSSVTSPTTAGTNAMGIMHLNKFALASDLAKPGGLLAMLDDLAMHTSSMGRLQRNNLIAQIFGKSRGIGNIAGLLNALPQMQQIYNGVTGATPNLLMQHFAESKTTNAFKFAQIQAGYQRAMIAFGDAIEKTLLPLLVKLIPYLTKVVTDFSKLPNWMQKWIVILMGGLVVLSPLLIALGGLLRAASTIAGAFKGAYKWITKLGTASEIAAGEEGSMGLKAFAGGLARVIPLLAAFALILANMHQIKKAVHDTAHYWTHPKDAVRQHFTGAATGKSIMGFGGVPVGHGFGSVNLPFGLGHVNLSGAAKGAVNAIGHLFSLPFQAQGGIATRGGLSVVGERGPEIVNLPLGASVIPLPGNALSDINARFADGVGDIHLTVNTVLDSKVIATSTETVERKRQNRK